MADQPEKLGHGPKWMHGKTKEEIAAFLNSPPVGPPLPPPETIVRYAALPGPSLGSRRVVYRVESIGTQRTLVDLFNHTWPQEQAEEIAMALNLELHRQK